MGTKLWKRLSLVTMIVITIMTMTACSKKEEKTETTQDTKSEYTYQSSFENIATGMDYIFNVCKKENRIYMLGMQWTEDKKKKGNEVRKLYLIHCAVDGSDVQKIELKSGGEDYPSIFAADNQNQLHFLTQEYRYNEKTQEEKTKYYTYTLDEKGKIINQAELKLQKLSKEDYFYPMSIGTVFFDGKVYIASGSNIYSFDENGKAGKVYKIRDQYIEGLIVSEDGKLYLYGEVNGVYGLSEFDLDTEKTKNNISFENYSISDLRTLSFGGEGEENRIYLGDGNNFYSADLSTGEIKEEINWLNGDINGDNILNCFLLEDGKFLVVDSSYDQNGKGDTTEFITLNKVKASDIKEKKIITFACLYLDYTIKEQILSFNKTNQNYRVQVKNYDAYEDAMERMNMDIASGNLPDILDVSMGVSKGQMIKKGMLADLYSFIENDKEIKKEDFIPSILKVIETDGKLYYLPPTFGMKGLVSGKKTMGDITEWSVDDMIDLYQNMPEDHVFMTLFMEPMTRQLFIQDIFISQMEDYVDFSTGEVKFNSEGFIKLMEFSKEFPDEKKLSYESQESMPTLIEKGKLILNELNLSSIGDIGMYTGLYKKQGGYTVLGYPTKEKSNRIAVSFMGSAFAILEQSDKKEGAWEFMRQFYTYEYQKNPKQYGGFPTRQDALEQRLEYAQAKKAYTDEDGTRVEPINMAYGFDGYTIEIKPIHKKEAEVIRSLVERIGTCVSYDVIIQDIFAIVQEEMEAFFAGDKSAEETAEIIQNRVGIYISENS